MSSLREIRRQRGWTQLRVIVALQELAQRRGIPIPEDRESVRVRMSSWENGRSSPTEPYLSLLAEVLGVPTAALVTDVRAVGTATGRLVIAARESLQFATWAELGQETSAAIDHVAFELARIAASYVYTSPGPLFADLLKLRDITFSLLHDHPRPRQARELFFLAGTVCVMLAQASQELGDASSAMAQARTAWTCAQEADHDGLRAWVRGTAALIAEWTERPGEAIRLTRDGQSYAQQAESRTRLAAIEARARARAGDAIGAMNALDTAMRKSDCTDAIASDDVESFGGVLTFPVAKQRYYAGSTLVLLGEHERAETMALEAIRIYEASPAASRSYGDEALARVAVVTSRLAQGDLDGCREIIRPVLALPEDQRIEQLAIGLRRVASQLAGGQIADAREARDLASEVRAFTAGRALPPEEW